MLLLLQSFADLPTPSQEKRQLKKPATRWRLVGGQVVLLAYLGVVGRRLVEGWERIAVGTAVDLGLRRPVEVVVGSTVMTIEMDVVSVLVLRRTLSWSLLHRSALPWSLSSSSRARGIPSIWCRGKL